MPQPVYRVVQLLSAVVSRLPIGTNLSLLLVLWMLVSGQLLETRGAVLPGLARLGLSSAAVRRAWAALGRGRWRSSGLLRCWARVVEGEGHWQPRVHGGYRVVAADITAYWRPRLQGCLTKHYHAVAGKALPAIPLGLVARIGRVAEQRLGLPVVLVRADEADPSPSALLRKLLQEAGEALAADELLVTDREFHPSQHQAAGVTRYVTRLPKNATARRAGCPPYQGRGRPTKYGALVRPLPRQYKERLIAATPADQEARWQDGETTVRAERWCDLVLADAPVGSRGFDIVAIHDPRHAQPLLLASPLELSAQELGAAYADRWPIEQLPLAGKQMIGAARQFVHAPETCQRLPELSLLAGAILSYAAATAPAIPTGTWDRQPRRTPGRLRRALALAGFPEDAPHPARLRRKKAVTSHLRTGAWGQQHPRSLTSAVSSSARQDHAQAEIA
jgi:hypothetical protein